MHAALLLQSNDLIPMPFFQLQTKARLLHTGQQAGLKADDWQWSDVHSGVTTCSSAMALAWAWSIAAIRSRRAATCSAQKSKYTQC